eukprot:5577651-Pleurochrysis_carterae.AAC.1
MDIETDSRQSRKGSNLGARSSPEVAASGAPDRIYRMLHYVCACKHAVKMRTVRGVTWLSTKVRGLEAWIGLRKPCTSKRGRALP